MAIIFYFIMFLQVCYLHAQISSKELSLLIKEVNKYMKVPEQSSLVSNIIDAVSHNGTGQALPSFISQLIPIATSLLPDNMELSDLMPLKENGQSLLSMFSELAHGMTTNNFTELITMYFEIIKDPVSAISDLLGIFPAGMTQRCRSDLEDFFKSLAHGTTSWGWQMLDALGKPPSGMMSGNLYWVGNFWQCLNIKVASSQLQSKADIVGEYCLTRLFVNKKIKVNLTHFAKSFDKSIGLYIGVCFPSSCSANDVAHIYDYIAEYFDNKILLEAHCQTDKQSSMDSTATIITIFLFIPLILVIISTAYIYLHKREKSQPTQENQDFVNAVCTIFCAQKSCESLLSQPTISSRSISCTHGIKALTAMGVIWGHIINNMLELNYFKNVLDYDNNFNHFVQKAQAFPYGVTLVFFMLSGFSLIYHSAPLETVTNSSKKYIKSAIVLIFSRYIRITFPYFFVALFIAGPFHYLGKGPVWPLIKQYQSACRENWLQRTSNVLQPVSSNGFLCSIGEWYFPNDFIIYAFGVIIVFSMLKKLKLIMILNGIFFLIPLICICVYAVKYNVSLYISNSKIDFNTIFNETSGAEYWDRFDKTWTLFYSFVVWIPSFACGMFSGFYFSYYKKNNHLSFPICHYILGLIAFITSAILIKHYTDVYYEVEKQPLFVSVGYIIFVNFIWTYTIHWIILHCVIFPSGLINKFLSCPLMVFLGKISYGLFIIQMPMFLYYYNTMSEPSIATLQNKVYDYVLVMVQICLASTLLYIIVESPTNRFINHIKGKSEYKESSSC